ncbi:hypothetical protein [uncultured Ruminococcus sp.]|uniref:hypothetical protein n=1 Tax=uncultured Ruminococcus sp. TaxID=165186 RepID=UPI0025F7CE63|nr:hypothetical protein [uncultured Ruminococcus sp.]
MKGEFNVDSLFEGLSSLFESIGKAIVYNADIKYEREKRKNKKEPNSSSERFIEYYEKEFTPKKEKYQQFLEEKHRKEK